jgi:ParB-like chromosome segregation protein Spo0J
VDVDPILVTADTYEIIDGRHRKAALEMLDRTSVACELIPQADRASLIAMAYKANYGGSLKPTRVDTEHTIELLLGQGVGRNKISDMLPLPPSLARKYISNVQANIAKRNLRRAVIAVADNGMSVAEAATEFRVDPESLKAEIRGVRKSVRKFDMAALKGGIQSRTKSFSLRNAALLKSLIERYDDGEVSREQVAEVIGVIIQSLRKAAKSVQAWEKRLDRAACEHTQEHDPAEGDAA